MAGRPRRRRRSDLGTAAVFLAPSLVGLTLFLIVPLAASLLLSFSNWTVMGEPRFVGLANYIRLATADPVFWKVVGVTLTYTAEYLVLNLVLSLAMAVWIASLSWGKTLFRLVFFLPTFTPLVGLALVCTVAGEWKAEPLASSGSSVAAAQQVRLTLTLVVDLQKWEERRRARTKRTKFPATCHVNRMETHSRDSG